MVWDSLIRAEREMCDAWDGEKRGEIVLVGNCCTRGAVRSKVSPLLANVSVDHVAALFSNGHQYSLEQWFWKRRESRLSVRMAPISIIRYAVFWTCYALDACVYREAAP